MQIEVRGDHSLMQRIIREHVERRLRFAVGRFDGRVRRIECAIVDANGRRGGVDKATSLTVHLKSGDVVRGEAIDADFCASVDRAIARVTRSVVRVLSRSRTLRRNASGPKYPEGILAG